MERFFKRSGSVEATGAREEAELLKQKVGTMQEVVVTLEKQLAEEKQRYDALRVKTDAWKERIKQVTHEDRTRIVELEAKLAAVEEAQGGADVASAVDRALEEVKTQYEARVAAMSSRLVEAEEARKANDDELNETKAQLERMKEIHLDLQQRFADEMAAITDRNDTSAGEAEQLNGHIAKLQEEIASLENHSHQQHTLLEISQTELVEVRAANTQLQNELAQSRATLNEIQEKQATWKQKVVEMKRKDAATIESLQHQVQLLSRAPSLEPVVTSEHAATADGQAVNERIQLEDARETSRAFEEQMEEWKEKAAIIRKRDQEAIETLQIERDQLRDKLALLLAQRSATPTDNIHGADAQAECNALRQQLEEAQREVDAARAQAQQLEAQKADLRAEADAAAQSARTSEEALQQLKSSLVTWKEKVRAAKLCDAERIAQLQQDLLTSKELVERLQSTLSSTAEKLTGRHAEPATAADVIADALCAATEALRAVDIEDVTESISLDEKVSALIAFVRTTQAEKESANEARATAESELQAQSRQIMSAEEAAELREENAELQERCELLRKEIKRQREAFQRERAQTEAASTAVSEPPVAPRSSGGVLEGEAMSLAAVQSQRERELRALQTRLQSLEKENDTLKRDAEHNNTLVAEYTSQIEALQANERVQMSSEYIKNIVLQFLCASTELRPKMIPAIATVMEFSSGEKQAVQMANPQCPKFH